MKTPILIPAYNAEKHIQRTLSGVCNEQLEPIVLANGCEDDTVKIATEMGVRVIDIEDPGKMPALQTGFRSLGERALGPVLTIDADSRPDFPRHFARVMTGVLMRPGVGAVTGPYRYVNNRGNPSNYARSGRAYLRSMFANQRRANYACGRNMGLHLRNDEMLDAFLSLPNYWPGEDRAIADKIEDLGGQHVHCVDPRAVVSTSDETKMPLLQRIFLQFSPDRYDVLVEQYVSRGPTDSFPYVGRERESSLAS